MGKRQNGEGTIRQRTNGSWEARLTYADPVTGKARRASFYGRTAAAARASMNAARKRLDSGAPVKDAAVTVADWVDKWLDTALKASSRKAATKDQYTTLARKHLTPEPFGGHRLDRLKPVDVEALLAQLREVKGLSDSTIRTVYTVLRLALEAAVANGMLARNPSAQVARPGVEKREAPHLTAAEVAQVLEATKHSRYYAALVLIATTGLRRGEAVGLRWDRVDLKKRQLFVAATTSRVGGKLVTTQPKTARSRRVVPLAPAMVSLLEQHRAQQDLEREKAANLWEDSGLVFTTEFGGPVEPRNLLRVIESAGKRAGVERVGLHTLRHSAATAWLERGLQLKAVSDLLGHSSTAVTGDIYAHAAAASQEQAVVGLATLLITDP